MKKEKLELTWIGNEKRLKLELRIVLEDTEKSYHAMHGVTDKDIFDNRPIFGDNTNRLKAENLPMAPPEPGQMALFGEEVQ